MQWDLSLLTPLLTIFSLIISPIVFIGRTMIKRIDNLEEAQKSYTTKEEVRLIVADKIEPIREDLSEIKTRIDKIMDHLVNK